MKHKCRKLLYFYVLATMEEVDNKVLEVYQPKNYKINNKYILMQIHKNLPNEKCITLLKYIKIGLHKWIIQVN